MNKWQKKIIKTILKEKFLMGYKLASFDQYTFYPFEEYPETVIWNCTISYVIGEGLYWVINLSQDNDEPIKIHYTTINDGLFDKLREKQKAFDRDRERRYRECGYGLGR